MLAHVFRNKRVQKSYIMPGNYKKVRVQYFLTMSMNIERLIIVGWNLQVDNAYCQGSRLFFFIFWLGNEGRKIIFPMQICQREKSINEAEKPYFSKYHVYGEIYSLNQY